MIPISRKYYEFMSMDLNKRQKLDADSKALQQINFTVKLDRAEGTQCFLVLKKQNKQF